MAWPVDVHALRSRLRESLRTGAVGTFVKLPAPEVLELCAAAGFDFVVIDLEHSQLSESRARALAGHACLLGLPALVRLPRLDPALINRLLEAGAAGIQLSMLSSPTQTRDLRRAALYAPEGARSISLAHRAAAYGTRALTDVIHSGRSAPPVLVGQIESEVELPLSAVLQGLDVAFVGTTDLAVSLGLQPGSEALAEQVREIRDAAHRAGVGFGGWVPDEGRVGALGLDGAGYLVVGSDLQLLAGALSATRKEFGNDG